MKFSPAAALVFVGVFVLIGMAASSNGGAVFHAAEAVATIVILVGLAGFLRPGARTR